MTRRLPIPLLLAPLSACVTPGDAAWSGLHANGLAGAYSTSLGGNVRTRSAAGPGTVRGNFDVDRVGQGDNVLTALGEVRLGIAPFELAVSAFDYSETGRGRFTGSFLGTPYTGAVRSDFDLRVLKGTLGIDVVNSAVARAGILVGVDYLDADLRLDDLATGVSAVVDEQLPVPVAGVRADVKLLDKLRLGGEVTGLDVSVQDFDATFLDAEAGLYFQPLSHFEVVLGWREVTIDFAGDTSSTEFVDVDVGFSGPFLAAGLTF